MGKRGLIALEFNGERMKHPRPDFYRENWLALDGEWEFEFDDCNIGVKNGWNSISHKLEGKISVPFCFQSKLSNICDTARHEVIWYARDISLNLQNSKRVLLNFGAVDYHAVVWVNGNFAMEHCGGYTPFHADITDYLDACGGNARITVRVGDYCRTSQPRGKQHWDNTPERCWYTPTSGIWQPVWLEFTGAKTMEGIRVTPVVDEQSACVDIKVSRVCSEMRVNWLLSMDGNVISRGAHSVIGCSLKFSISIPYDDPIDNDKNLLSPDNPKMYDFICELTENGSLCDKVTASFGMRKIECRNGAVFLNNHPLYQRLVLVQGYFFDGLLTPPSPECYCNDLKLIKDMGFNGLRMHQKIEDPRFYCYADLLGLLVWEEMPSAYEFCAEEISMLTHEWMEIINRDYNHPCIIIRVPFNESWGVRDILHDKRQQDFAAALRHLAKALDPSRLVNTNDGWEQVATDIVGIHDYESNKSVLESRYKNWNNIKSCGVAGKFLFANGFEYSGEPIIFSEFGGVAIEDGNGDSWGYQDKVCGTEGFIERIAGIMAVIKDSAYLSGFCYTQFSDTQQETNGLLDEERRPKIPISEIRKLFGNKV
jgi:beta-galactosidase/beta-glucuronidase